MDYKICRRISGTLFLTANLSLFFANFTDTNIYQLIASLLFISCSTCLILSAKNHRWLFYCSFALIGGAILVAISNRGEGDHLNLVGMIVGISAGLLDLRAAMQRETGKQYKLPFILKSFDKYPLAMGSLTEQVFNIFILGGAILNNDIRLAVIIFLWMIAHSFLIASDEYFRQMLINKVGRNAI